MKCVYDSQENFSPSSELFRGCQGAGTVKILSAHEHAKYSENR